MWRATCFGPGLSLANFLFLSTPSVWRATTDFDVTLPPTIISIHALRVEGDRPNNNIAVSFEISIHALRVEGDGAHTALASKFFQFLSTPSVWRATGLGSPVPACCVFLSTPSVWRATKRITVTIDEITISIHALRVEGDSVSNSPKNWSNIISIHALRVEGDVVLQTTKQTTTKFLSTPSVWRATDWYQRLQGLHIISIHALRVEGDPCLFGMNPLNFLFLSTPSVWRATSDFRCRIYDKTAFLSTPSVWRATYCIDAALEWEAISIHALRVEGDEGCVSPLHDQDVFLSTPSVWRATSSVNQKRSCKSFLSTPSVWRATEKTLKNQDG